MSKFQAKIQQTKNTKIEFAISIAGLIFFSFLWRLQVLDLFPDEYDEGIHLMVGKLWSAGYRPYTEIFVSYPPFFLWSLGLPWKLFEQTMALQLLMTTYALSGVLAVVYLGTVYNSRLAGIIAGVCLSFAPAYFIPSFAVMTEVPSVGIAVAAIALAEKYRRGGAWPWAFFAGSSLAFGLSLKVLPVYAGPFAILLIVARYLVFDPTCNQGAAFTKTLYRARWIVLRDAAILAGGFLGVFFLPLLLFDLATFYEQVVGMRLVSRAVEHNPFDSNSRDILRFLFSNPGLTAMTLYGLVFVVIGRLRDYWLLVVWFILIWLSMYLHVPLRAKHMPIFLPVLALLAGFAGNHMVNFIKQLPKKPFSLQTMAISLAILIVLGMVGWRIPQVIAENNGQTLNSKENEERLTAIRFINTIATPDDCVIADNPVFLHQTNRLPPPELAETSQTRIDTGLLTLSEVIGAIQRDSCHVVAVVTPRFGESIPGLTEWLAANYLGLHAQDETFIYFAKKGADTRYTSQTDIAFDNILQLYGVRLPSQAWQPGTANFVSLYWNLNTPLQDNYEYHIMLRVGGEGKPSYQVSRLPFAGFFDPTGWQVNESGRDTFWLNIPADLPSGPYDLYLALCLAETDSCLPAGPQGQTEVLIGQIILAAE